MSGDYEKILNYLWKAEILKLNVHFPKRKKLQELMDEEEPHFSLRDGTKSFADKKEIESLARHVPGSFREKIELPIVFMRRGDIFVISGGKLDTWLTERLLKTTDSSPHLLESYTPRKSFQRYEVASLRRKYSSLITLIFGSPTQ